MKTKQLNNMELQIDCAAWIAPFIAYCQNAINKGKRVFVVAIARKMSRLFEVYSRRDQRLKFFLDSVPRDLFSIITEHAVPVGLRNATPVDTEVLLLDDLIVYGDTVQTVSENIYYLTGIRSKIIAMAATDYSELRFLFADVLFPNEGRKDLFLSNDRIPSYTAKNSWDIIGLKRPIDLEFPIVYVALKDNQAQVLKNHLEQSLAKAFPTAYVYTIEHKMPDGKISVNVNVLFRCENSKINNNDFSKLRFFIAKDRLSIVGFFPNVWDIPFLRDIGARLSGRWIQECWNQLKKSIELYPHYKEPDVNPFIRQILKSEYVYRIERTNVIWANYLLSFENLMRFRDEIKSALSVVGISNFDFDIDIRDLNLIAGPDMSAMVYSYLMQQMNESDMSIDVYYEQHIDRELLEVPLIPESYKDEYNRNKINDVLLSTSYQTALSLIFYRLWKEFGMINNRKKVIEEKVRIGETYDSLEDKLSLVYKDADLYKKISQWIDSRIDLGIIVPKYEYFIDQTGTRNWRRVFRAGEREDLMIDIARFAVVEIYNAVHDGKMEFLEFDDVIDKCLEKLDQSQLNQLPVEIFAEDMNIGPHHSIAAAYCLWIYLRQLGALKMINPRQVTESRLCLDDEGNPLFTSTALFEA